MITTRTTTEKENQRGLDARPTLSHDGVVADIRKIDGLYTDTVSADRLPRIS